MSDRLRARVERDFGAAGKADEVQRRVEAATAQAGPWKIFDRPEGVERVQAAIVLWAQGDVARLQDSMELAGQDWRDVLVRGVLAEADWPARLDRELGSPS